jgi:hypothetical protein
VQEIAARATGEDVEARRGEAAGDRRAGEANRTLYRWIGRIWLMRRAQ